MVDENNDITTYLTPRERFHETCWFNIELKIQVTEDQTSFVENQDWIIRQFGINVYSNPSSDRNEIILDYVDQLVIKMKFKYRYISICNRWRTSYESTTS